MKRFEFLLAPLVYIVVQCVVYGIEFSIFAVLHHWIGLDALLANVVSKINAGFCAVIAHRYITFKATDQPLARQAAIYFLLMALNTLLATLLLSLLLSFGLHVNLAKFVSDVALVLVSFVLSKKVVFRSSRPPA
jgi:putative flippase GtrA